MNERDRIGVLGGTFDPIHQGHLDLALAARDALGLDSVRLVPSSVPPHRPDPPHASTHHRFAMIALAVQPYDGLIASDIELQHARPSYTATTLRRLHARGLGAEQICFITGADAFAEIATWRDYPALLDLAHFVVVSRPGSDLERLRSGLPDLAGRFEIAGRGEGRRPATGARSLRVLLLEAATPDVSSSEVRRRLGAGEAVDAMIPPAVETHIRRHGLYDAAQRSPTSEPCSEASSLHHHG